MIIKQKLLCDTVTERAENRKAKEVEDITTMEIQKQKTDSKLLFSEAVGLAEIHPGICLLPQYIIWFWFIAPANTENTFVYKYSFLGNR